VSTCAFIILDGVVVPGRFLHGEGAASRGGVRVSKTTERPFVFSKVKQTGIVFAFSLSCGMFSWTTDRFGSKGRFKGGWFDCP
jgi:hypothetical protein